MKIIISKKFCNDNYSTGSILEMIHTVKIKPLSSTVNTKVVIVTGSTSKEITNIEFNSILSLTKENIKTLQKIILEIKSSEDVKETSDNQFDMKVSYTTVKIDKFSYKIPSQNILLVDLLNILKCSLIEMLITEMQKKLIQHYKFVYQAGEIKIANTQCELCNYYSEDSKNSCEKYAEIPDEIKENTKKCKYIKTGNEPW